VGGGGGGGGGARDERGSASGTRRRRTNVTGEAMASASRNAARSGREERNDARGWRLSKRRAREIARAGGKRAAGSAEGRRDETSRGTHHGGLRAGRAASRRTVARAAAGARDALPPTRRTARPRTPTVTTATPGPRSSADRAKPSKRGVAFFFERLRGRDWRKGRARALLITKKKLITRSTRRKASSSRLCSPAHSAISRGGTPPALPRATPVCPRFSRSATR
jgi:hypothetical protein